MAKTDTSKKAPPAKNGQKKTPKVDGEIISVKTTYSVAQLPTVTTSSSTTPIVELRTPQPASIPKVTAFQVVVWAFPPPVSLTATLVSTEGDMDILPMLTTANHKTTFTFNTQMSGVSGHPYMLWIQADYGPMDGRVVRSWDPLNLDS